MAKHKKTGFTDEEIEAMKKEARETPNGDFFDIFRREAEKLLGKLKIANLNQFLLDSHNNSPAFDIEAFDKEMAEFNKKYPTEAERDRAYELMRRGYDV